MRVKSILPLVAVAASAAFCGFHPQPPSGAVACTIGGSACCPADYICVGRGAISADGLPDQTGTCWKQQDVPPEALSVAHDYTPTILDDPSCLVTDWLPPTMSQPDGGLLGAGGRIVGGGGQGGAHPITPGGGGYGYPDAGVTYAGALIAKGSSQLIDMFVGDAGIYVVTIDAIMLLSRNGGVVANVVSPRPITSAAFDGIQLVVTDQARWTAYDAALVPGASADLLESCKYSVLVSQNRFVCAPAGDVYYTYDTMTGALLASSVKYSYHGIPIRRVPGTDDFVAVSVGTSPTDFHLYSVTPTGLPVYISDSPYHGDFPIDNTYAFDGAPPVHVVTSGGLLLKIYDTNCAVPKTSFTSKCFVKDGNVGALSGSQSFTAMDSDAAGILYGFVDPTGEYSDVPCSKSCLLERIEVASRTIMSSSVIRLPMVKLVAFRNDAASNSVVVGYVFGTSTYYGWDSNEPYPGYGISVIHY